MGALLRKSLTITCLRAAFRRVRENHGQAGVDGVDVESYAHGLNEKILALRVDVLGGRYRPSPLKRLWLPRPGKPSRPLAVPTVRDRILQTAVAKTLTPLLEDEFEECSYAYRQGRSVRMAVERIGHLQRRGYRWVVEADIEKFFDNIPHDKLLIELREIARDDELIELVRTWLTTPVRDGDRLQQITLGVPQGSPISPLLSNLYLDHLDEALLDEGYALVRYADDFIVLAKSRDRADAAVELSTRILRDLELKLNPLKTRVVNFETGFKFLGWTFVRSLAVPASRTGRRSSVAETQADSVVPTKPSPAGELSHTSGPMHTEMGEAFVEALVENPDWHPQGVASEALVRDHQEKPLYPHGHVPVGVSEKRPEAKEQDEPLSVLPPASMQRTLYLVDPAASLATKNHHLLVRHGEETILDLPAVNVDQVMLFGRNHMTTAAIVCCLHNDIPVAFLSRMGKFYGRLEPPSGGAVRLQTAQFSSHAKGKLDLPLAREIIRGKLGNSILLLNRYTRHRRNKDDTRCIQDAINSLRSLVRRIRSAPDLDTLRGLEGAGAVAYFGVWRLWLSSRWTFGARVARSGTDPINALMDLGYTLLRQSVAGLIQARGLNPWLGHLHRPKPGHMALASDLMEEFRPLVVDAAILNACLNNRINQQDFVLRGREWRLRPEAVRSFIRDIETRLNSERRHPHNNALLDLRRIMDYQIRSLCAVYRQDDPSAFRACVFR